MITIAHPKVTTKPPIYKTTTKKSKKSNVVANAEKKRETKKLSSNKERIECSDCSEHEASLNLSVNDLTNLFSNIDNDGKYMESTSDCNQNVIQSNSSPFDQLCHMISDLEQNISLNHEIVDVETSFLPAAENNVTCQIKYLDQIEPEKDVSPNNCQSPGSTYDEIMTFLGTLEQTCPLPDLQTSSTPIPSEQTCQLVPTANKISDDLATALLQLEDREGTIKILKNQLKTERKAVCDKLEQQQTQHTAELQSQKVKYQNIIKRHQKFVEQLIDEKKQLTEKCNVLAQKIKDIEVKHEKEMKVAIDRHNVEIQRAKEMCLASEKIRRERWLESKTSKIKEMTVKGLEPELRSMVEQHQQEIQDIRSAHMKELQDVELRTIRRSNQQLEQLRLELTASHDKLLAQEKDAIRLRYQEKFDEQETLLQNQQRKYFQELQQEKKKFADEQTRRDIERDEIIQKNIQTSQERIERLTKQFEDDKKLLQENYQAERVAWIENFKRQQTTKFELTEAKIRDECNRERDRQIELAISRLEKESRDVKMNLQKTADNKLQCLKEKYETDIGIYKENEKILKEKLNLIQEKFDELQMNFQKIEEKLGKCLVNLHEADRDIEKITRERDHAKKLARQEIECEKRELEEKIGSLYREITQINANKDTHMAQLYSRIKLIITQKDIMIKNITKELNDVKSKCDHLEKLLDQQRKEYVLKTL